MTHMTVHRKTLEVATQNKMLDLYGQSEVVSMGWMVKARQMVAALIQPTDNRFMDPRLTDAYEKSKAQVDAISRLIR